MNQYNVVYLDVTNFIYLADQKRLTYRSEPDLIVERVSDELRRLDSDLSDSSSLEERMIQIAEKTHGRKFVFIIDEWDAVIREAKNDDLAQRAYLNLLRGWFKNANFTARAVAAAYMTGILPIRKDASQSAISDFREYTMLEPGAYAEYVGFTESEVRKICEKKKR